MDKSEVVYTVNSLLEDCDSIHSATKSFDYLISLAAKHPDSLALTPEVMEAFQKLYIQCSIYCTTYANYQAAQQLK